MMRTMINATVREVKSMPSHAYSHVLVVALSAFLAYQLGKRDGKADGAEIFRLDKKKNARVQPTDPVEHS